MEVGIEISLYPLQPEYRRVIHEFIDRLGADTRLRVIPGSLSTQVFGDYDVLMERLTREMRSSLDSGERVAFLIKLLGPFST